jgi:DNA modification methylase
MLELNKIHCGDSYELIKQIPDKSIDCIYTDIPYLYQQGGCGKSELGERTSKKILQLMGLKEDYLKEKGLSRSEALIIAKNKKKQNLDLVSLEDGIDYSIFEDLCRVMKKINIYIWCSKLQILDILQYFIESKNCYFEILVWNKTNPTPTTNNSWLPDIEYCLYFREKGVKLNDGYELKSKWYTSPANVEDKIHYKHPTIKPLDLVKRHLLHTTQENDIVLDCFSGSGTTCVACKELGRQFIGIEIDEKWHKISVERLNGINAKGQTSIFTDFENL